MSGTVKVELNEEHRRYVHTLRLALLNCAISTLQSVISEGKKAIECSINMEITIDWTQSLRDVMINTQTPKHHLTAKPVTHPKHLMHRIRSQKTNIGDPLVSSF